MRRAALLASLLCSAAACGDFETPSIVLDLRILGVSVEPPEVVSPFDPENPTEVDLEDVEVCALVADPNAFRPLSFNMVACAPTDSHRCDDPTAPFVDIGFGTVPDPEEAPEPVSMCATLAVSAPLVSVIEDSVAVDSLAGFGGVAVQIEFYTTPDADDLEVAEFAHKRMLYSPQIPEERVANQNPWLDEITFARGDAGDEEPLPLGRCRDITAIEVAPGEEITFLPVEPDGVREDYLVPTFDGGSRELTENLTYAWYATAGEWSRENSGGPRDIVGNGPPLDSTWTAPDKAEEIGDGLDVGFWFVQRDERGGQSWYQSCAHVAPE